MHIQLLEDLNQIILILIIILILLITYFSGNVLMLDSNNVKFFRFPTF